MGARPIEGEGSMAMVKRGESVSLRQKEKTKEESGETNRERCILSIVRELLDKAKVQTKARLVRGCARWAQGRSTGF